MSGWDRQGEVGLAGGGEVRFATLGLALASSVTPILLVRPLGGSMALWGEFATRLAIERGVVAFDPRGAGASSDPPLGITTREMAKDAVAVLDHLGVEETHVFGLSLGGMVASWIAVDAAARVRRLVLASTLPSAGAMSSRALSKVVGFARAFAKPALRAEVNVVREVLSEGFRRRHPERTRAILRAVQRGGTSRRNLAVLAFAAARHDAVGALGGIRAETLLLYGERDVLAGRATQAELRGLIPHAEIVRIAGAGHDLSLEMPHETAARVLAFLRE